MARDNPEPGGRLLQRQRVLLAFYVAAAIALIPAYAMIAPPSRWDEPMLLAVLGVLAVVAQRSEVQLPSGLGFDAKIALMLLAVALVGPQPALVIVVLPWIDRTITGRDLSPAPPARLTAPWYLAVYGWSAIAAALLLQHAGVDESVTVGQLGWLLGAGGVLYAAGWALGPALYAPFWLGQPFRAPARAFVDMLPTAAVMIALGAITVVLTDPLGIVGLALFAVIAILPQSFLTYAARARPVSRLDQPTATRRYAHALAVQLGLPRSQRRHLARVVDAATRHPPTGDPVDYTCAMLARPARATYEAELSSEWWNGAGALFHLRGHEIPLAARVLAVAHTWSALTARGTPELSHHATLEHLRAVAGRRLDPIVVSAAYAVIGQERVTAAEPAPEPRLHHLRIPAPLRRALTAT